MSYFKNRVVMKRNYFLSFLISMLLLNLASCKKDQPKAITELSIVTNGIDPANITDSEALFSIQLIADGNSPITAFGYCWSRINSSPTIDDVDHMVVYNNAKIGFTYNSKLDKLNPYDTYYVRAFATNEAGKTAYGETKTFKTKPGTFTDIDGNLYHTITIGDQVWMQENWKCQKMSKSSAIITIVSDNNVWKTTVSPALCWYSNDNTNTAKNTYGGLYNWYAITNQDFAPNGWHVPLFSEASKLATNLGGTDVAGGKLKDIKLTANGGTWVAPNTGATNESNFTGLAAGFRLDDSSFNGLGIVTEYWLISTDSSFPYAAFSLHNNEAKVHVYWYSNNQSTARLGGSVRLLRDTPANF